MINGKPIEFLNVLYTGQDIVYSYEGVEYWFQGYEIDRGFHMEIMQHNPSKEENIWEYDGASAEECKQAFLSAKIFSGETFWHKEQDITWID